MTSTDQSANPSRRKLLLGIGALPAVWALAPIAAHAEDTPGLISTPKGVAARSAAAEPECLADLINQGVVKRADLVAR
ncbi:MAG: hypothetical protein L0H93_16915 [Nocardioides sp.]|nr:hypothetical protein [Nocardioides sp.]